MNRAVLIGAVLALALLAAFYYFVDIRGSEKAEEEAAASRRLVADFDHQLVRAITIESGTGSALRVVRSGTEAAWRVEAPEEAEADPDVLQQLLDTLDRLTAGENPFPPGDDGLSPYGLVPPHLSVTVDGEGGGRLARLEVGGPAPIGAYRYAKVRDTGEVGLVTTAETDAVPSSLFDLREKRLVRFGREDVWELHVEIAEQPAVVFRRQGDNWEIVEPLEFDADRELVGNLLWELAECRALDFPGDAEIADFPMIPTLRIGLILADGSEIGARIGALADSGDGVYAAGDSGPVMMVDTTILDSALRPADQWRELRPFPRYHWEVDGLTVAGAGAEAVTWRKDGNGVWQREGDLLEGEPASEDTIRQALDLLTGLKACGLSWNENGALLEETGLAEPAFTVTLNGGAEGTAIVESLALGFPDRAAAPVPDSCGGDEPLVCGMRPGGNWVYLINEPGRDQLGVVLERLCAGPPVEDGPSGE